MPDRFPALTKLSTTTSRRLALLVTLSVLATLGFRMLNYALTWKFGWQDFPSLVPDVESTSDPAWAHLESSATEILTRARSHLATPALSAAISLEGRRAWAGAVGHADFKSRTTTSPSTKFRLGSSSKPITSVALGTLIGQKRIDLEMPVGGYIKDLGEPLASVTTRQAMSHTAGIRNYGVCWCFPIWEHLNRRPYGQSVRPSLSIFEDDALLFVPGTAFSYSSYGTNTVGAVIESIAQVSFLDYLQSAVLEPLQMVDTGPDHQPGAKNMAAFYDVDNGRYRSSYPVNNSYKWPSGGLIGTPSDMLRLGQEMLAPTLFDQHTRDQLITPQVLSNGVVNPEGYALGWRYAEDHELFSDSEARKTTRLVTHHGISTGSTSYFAFYPDLGIVVSLMMNRSSRSIGPLARVATKLVELYIADGSSIDQ